MMTVNKVSRRKSITRAKLKVASQKEWIHLWKQHFENLFGKLLKVTNEPITKIICNQLDIKLGQFKQKELNLVRRKIKNRKAAGLDEIHPEIWKTRKLNNILLWYCNTVYNQNTINRWTKGCILPFPKKGDLRIAKNYQGITLTSIAAKIFNALLLNYLEPKITKILRKKQIEREINPWHHKFWLSIKFLKVFMKNPQGNTIIWRLLQDIWLHTQREDGANTSHLRSPQRNYCSHNNVI